MSPARRPPPGPSPSGSPPSAPPPAAGCRRARFLLAGGCLLAAVASASPAAAGAAPAPAASEPSPGAVSVAGDTATAVPPEGPEPDSAEPLWMPRTWALSAGVFDLVESDRPEAGVELRFAPRPLRLFGRDWRLEPALGAVVNEDAGYYGYLGLRLPVELCGRWRATPYFGAGIYSAGDGLDLGGALEFRSGLELSARLGERYGVGLSYYHLSNAGIYDLNPGAESLVLVLAVRPGRGGAGGDARGEAKGETGAGR